MGVDFAAGDSWHPILELPGKYPLQWTNQWSRQPGCYQLKSALAWHELEHVTGDVKFGRWYQTAVAKAIATKDEFLPGETPEKTMDRLHAYAYFLEGLLPIAQRSEARETIAEGIVRISSYLREMRTGARRSGSYRRGLRDSGFSD
jgi:hypothetical protein